MREIYEGNVFSCMGCVEGEEVITYKLNGKMIIESFEKMWNRLSYIFTVKKQTKKSPNLYMDVNNVQIYDTKKGFVNVKRVIRNISSNWVSVKIEGGRNLICTDDHPFYTVNRGRVKAKNLKIDDIVITNHSQISEETIEVDESVAWMLGFMICDSSYASGTPCASIALSGEDEIELKLKDVIKNMGDYYIETVERHRGKKGEYKDLKFRSNTDTELSNLSIKLCNIYRSYRKNKREVPDDILSWNKKARYAFLAGMIDADGYINSENTNFSTVQIGSTNKALALEQMRIAESLGMQASEFINHYDKKKPNKIRYRIEFIPDEKLINSIQCKKKREHFKVSKKEVLDACRESKIISVKEINKVDFSYDVTTESDFFEVSGIYSHNCRSFLSPWKDENGNYKWEGRFNQGRQICLAS